MHAQDLMTRNPACAKASDTARDVAHLMAEHDCGCVPVIDDRDGRVVGVITDRDLALRGVAQGKSPNTKVDELMTRDVICCYEDSEVAQLERLMSDRQIRRVVIASADGRCVGIVSQADLARAAKSGEVRSTEVADVVGDISAAGNTVPLRGKESSMPRYGSAGGGGAEYEPGPETD
jgi:CBS domain-containing protein